MAVLHLISHTHWDREWYLPFQEFRLKLVQLIDGTLDLLAGDRGFRHFMLDGQTIVLDDYLALRPDREREIAAHVRSGRLLIGPWYVLPDEFLVSPEAIVRNLLEGRRIAARFGRNMPVGYIPDPFGHIAQMPQILRGFGIETACVQRGLDDQPCEFWWQSPDGSQVLMAYLREGYGNAAGLPAGDPRRFLGAVRELGAALLPHSAAGHVALMYGTDHMQPARETSQALAFASRRLEGDRLVHSTLPAYVGGIRRTLGARMASLPVVEGELRSSKRWHLLPGVMSARMWIKQGNHACEELLEAWAEPFSTWAEWVGANGEAGKRMAAAEDSVARPGVVVGEAWRLLMQCHPHDSICGCSIDQVHDEMRPRFDQVRQMGEVIARQSLGRLAASAETRAPREAGEASAAIVVFNPVNWARSDRVEVDLELGPELGDLDIVDDRGVRMEMDRRGLGSRELIHTTLDREAFRSSIGMVHEGRVAGLNLQALEVARHGACAVLLVSLSSKGSPNRSAWEHGVREVNALLEEEAVTSYEVSARSVDETRVHFAARDVPGLGYRTFFVTGRKDGRPSVARPLPAWAKWLMPIGALLGKFGLAAGLSGTDRVWRRGPRAIENEFLRVEARARDGTLAVIHKPSGLNLHGLNLFEDDGDCGDEYNFCPPRDDRVVRGGRLRAVHMHRSNTTQELRLRLVLRLPGELAPNRMRRSRALVDMPVEVRARLTAGVDRVDLEVQVDNVAKDHRLRVLFPTPLRTESAAYDSHFEVVQRGIRLPQWDETWVEQPRPEKPQRRWVDISDGATGLMIANRGLPEVEVRPTAHGSEIALTLMRCVGWLSRDDFPTRRGHAGPALETPAAQMPGRHVFAYSILPHAGGWEQAYRRAHEFDRPASAVATALHRGRMPSSASLVQIHGGDFLVTAVKQAERGGTLVVRGVNLGKTQARVHLRPWRRFGRCQLARLDETPLSNLSLRRDGTVEIELRPAQVVTLLFSDPPSRTRR